MRPLPALALAGLSLLLTGCGAGAGGGDRLAVEPVDTVSREEFCAGYLSATQIYADPSRGPDVSEYWNAWMRSIAAVGLPADAPEQVRVGHALIVSGGADMPPVSSVEEIEDEVEPLTPAEDEVFRSFERWAQRQCGGDPLHQPMPSVPQ